MLFGCKEFSLAEHQKPGAFTYRAEFGLVQPFKSLYFNDSSHTIIQTEVLMETLQTLGL